MALSGSLQKSNLGNQRKRKMKKFSVLIIVAVVFIGFYQINAQTTKSLVSLSGNVTNAVTKEPVTVYLKILDSQGKMVTVGRSSSADKGKFYIPGLQPGETYYVEIKQKDFFHEKYEIKLPNTGKYSEISKDFLVKPLVKGIHIPIAVPPFEFNKSKLRFGVNDFLDDYKNSLINNATINFQIVCYPDNDKDKVANKKLTDERAKSLMNYFGTSGIDLSRITIQGMDSTDPNNPPPKEKTAKAKRYIGTSYIVVSEF
jgi:outer membrane protein OmpA-like peptidoglycan-associated protein